MPGLIEALNIFLFFKSYETENVITVIVNWWMHLLGLLRHDF